MGRNGEKCFGQLPVVQKLVPWKNPLVVPFLRTLRARAYGQGTQKGRGGEASMPDSPSGRVTAPTWVGCRTPGCWSWKVAMQCGKGAFGAREKKGCSPSLVMDHKENLPFAGFSPLLFMQLFHFRKSVSCGQASEPLQPHSKSASVGPVFFSLQRDSGWHNPVFASSCFLM